MPLMIGRASSRFRLSSPTQRLHSVRWWRAKFACTAFQVDRLTSQHVPTFAYAFNDDAAPPRYAPTNPPVATHETEIPYLFDLPNAPLQGALRPDQETLAASMRAAWAR